MKISNIFKGDKVIWMVFFFLCMISIVEVFSASSGLTYKSNNFIMPISKHLGTIAFGFIVCVITLNIPCRFFRLFIPFLLPLSVALLIAVLLIGDDVNGAQRQIGVGALSVQPSEIAKGTVVLIVAQILSTTQMATGTDKRAFKFILIVSAPIIFLILLENLSTAFLLALVVLIMMVIGRVPMAQIGKLLGVVSAAILAVFMFVMVFGHDKTHDDPNLVKVEQVENKKEKGALDKVFHRADTWKARIDKFLANEQPAPKDYDLDKDAQVAHANIAIVSSNVIGKGPGNSVERDFLAQAFSDFIFAIIIEETGIVGAGFVVLLYIILLYRTALISGRCENNFPAFLAMGLALLLVVQATFNMMVAVGFVPVTGQPLPLISKGGSATIINCAYIGAILSVSRFAKKKSESMETEKNVIQN